jgi:peptidoglycan/LPS O-acetylase OafA/YrhL
MTKNTERINILDGFRTLAILPVMLYHYFSRWTSAKNNVSLYPYDTKYDYFGLGYLGVEFFFIISGFVIFFTLERTNNISGFLKKRLFRLLPSMLIASVIIYFVFIYLDKSKIFENSHQIKNFIPSITLISPDIYNHIINNKNLQLAYLNGSFWSLWPEVQFYLLVSIIYFLNKEKFIRNYFSITTCFIFLNWILYNISHGNSLHVNLSSTLLSIYQNWFLDGFNLFSYIIYFNIGVLFYQIYKKRQAEIKLTYHEKILLVITLLLEGYFSYQKSIMIPYILMLTLFFIFIYKPEKLSLLEHKIFKNVGAASYFTYLIHENIGILFINLFGALFAPVEFVLPVLLILTIFFLSHFYYTIIENRISKWLKKLSDL